MFLFEITTKPRQMYVFKNFDTIWLKPNKHLHSNSNLYRFVIANMQFLSN